MLTLMRRCVAYRCYLQSYRSLVFNLVWATSWSWGSKYYINNFAQRFTLSNETAGSVHDSVSSALTITVVICRMIAPFFISQKLPGSQLCSVRFDSFNNLTQISPSLRQCETYMIHSSTIVIYEVLPLCFLRMEYLSGLQLCHA